MLYESTLDNILALVHATGYIQKEQLLRFFSDVKDSINVEYYLAQLVKNRLMDCDERTNIISWHGIRKIRSSEVQRRIQSLWILVSFRSMNVRDITLLPYPAQYMFVTHANDVYDVTTISSREEAAVAQKKMRLGQIEGVEDDVNHIAIVDNEALGQELGPYGFDSYCLLDLAHRPRYGTWS